jgi:hypothetical protein
MNELIIFTMLLAAMCVGLLIALCICIRKIINLQERQDYEIACMADSSIHIIKGWLMDISGQIDHLETQIPNRYKNQNGETGILYRKDEDK